MMTETVGWWIGSLCAGALLYCIATLIVPIVHPTVVPYPWPKGSHQQQQRDKSMTVVLAGSFNPPHNGHLAMLIYLAERYGKVNVVIGMNPSKTYPVLPDQRAELLRRMLQQKSAENVSVKVVTGYIWRNVKPLGARLFVRGVRSWERDGKEERILQIQNTWGPLVLGCTWPLPTIFLEGKPEYNHVSSTLIRDLCRMNASGEEQLATLVPQCVANDVARLYGV